MKVKLLLGLMAMVCLVVAALVWPRGGASYDISTDEALQEALARSGRESALRMMLESTPDAHKRDMAFLLANMPQSDLENMDTALLLENVEYANIAREKYSWAQALPEDVYLCDVLPHHVVDEVRDSWRKELYEMFAPAVDTCKSMYDAVCAVNANIPRLTGVDYNTKREKTNQSPKESMRQGMAS